MSGMHVRRSVAAVLLAVPWLAAPASGAEPSGTRTGWAELSRVKPGTVIVVQLNDGRRLERCMVGTTDDALDTVDLSLVSSRERREQVLALIRQSPQRDVGSVAVETDGTRVPIAQRFDRTTIVMVSRPKSVVFNPPAPLSWMLHYAGPCPNCDTAQTALAGETPLPSPLPRKAETDPLGGEVLYRAPASVATKPLDDVTWEQLRLILPASLRGK
jgi:hypothetical protein